MKKNTQTPSHHWHYCPYRMRRLLGRIAWVVCDVNGERQIPRNHDDQGTGCEIGVILVLHTIAIIITALTPLWWLGGALVLISLFMLGMGSVRFASNTSWLGIVLLSIAIVGWCLNWDVGITLWGMPLGRYLFVVYAVLGCVSVICRVWNALAWFSCDQRQYAYQTYHNPQQG